MILSTTPQIEGHTIREYKGIVTGETIIGANMFKDKYPDKKLAVLSCIEVCYMYVICLSNI